MMQDRGILEKVKTNTPLNNNELRWIQIAKTHVVCSKDTFVGNLFLNNSEARICADAVNMAFKMNTFRAEEKPTATRNNVSMSNQFHRISPDDALDKTSFNDKMKGVLENVARIQEAQQERIYKIMKKYTVSMHTRIITCLTNKNQTSFCDPPKTEPWFITMKDALQVANNQAETEVYAILSAMHHEHLNFVKLLGSGAGFYRFWKQSYEHMKDNQAVWAFALAYMFTGYTLWYTKRVSFALLYVCPVLIASYYNLDNDTEKLLQVSSGFVCLNQNLGNSQRFRKLVRTIGVRTMGLHETVMIDEFAKSDVVANTVPLIWPLINRPGVKARLGSITDYMSKNFDMHFQSPHEKAIQLQHTQPLHYYFISAFTGAAWFAIFALYAAAKNAKHIEAANSRLKMDFDFDDIRLDVDLHGEGIGGIVPIDTTPLNGDDFERIVGGNRGLSFLVVFYSKLELLEVDGYFGKLFGPNNTTAMGP